MWTSVSGVNPGGEVVGPPLGLVGGTVGRDSGLTNLAQRWVGFWFVAGSPEVVAAERAWAAVVTAVNAEDAESPSSVPNAGLLNGIFRRVERISPEPT